ncbi:hypothetical protein GJ496_008795 [Pomphorhynchus laevis]|nr:hypothetical protein GJ496_008795 [Pomphorhynchus laevis]
MSCNRAHDLVNHIIDTALRMADFTIAILGVVRVRKKLLIHNETVCIDLDDISMMPECNFRFNLSFDIALFRKMLRDACQRSKRAINELRICRLKRPHDIIEAQPVLIDKFAALTNKITALNDEIDGDDLVDRNELRDFKEISIMFVQLHTDVNLLICNLAHSIRMKDTVLFAAPVTDIMGVLNTVLVKLDCMSKRLSDEMQQPILPPRCKQLDNQDDEINNRNTIKFAEDVQFSSGPMKDEPDTVTETTIKSGSSKDRTEKYEDNKKEKRKNRSHGEDGNGRHKKKKDGHSKRMRDKSKDESDDDRGRQRRVPTNGSTDKEGKSSKRKDKHKKKKIHSKKRKDKSDDETDRKETDDDQITEDSNDNEIKISKRKEKGEKFKKERSSKNNDKKSKSKDKKRKDKKRESRKSKEVDSNNDSESKSKKRKDKKSKRKSKKAGKNEATNMNKIKRHRYALIDSTFFVERNQQGDSEYSSMESSEISSYDTSLTRESVYSKRRNVSRRNTIQSHIFRVNDNKSSVISRNRNQYRFLNRRSSSNVISLKEMHAAANQNFSKIRTKSYLCKGKTLSNKGNIVRRRHIGVCNCHDAFKRQYNLDSSSAFEWCCSKKTAPHIETEPERLIYNNLSQNTVMQRKSNDFAVQREMHSVCKHDCIFGYDSVSGNKYDLTSEIKRDEIKNKSNYIKGRNLTMDLIRLANAIERKLYM